MTKPYTGDYLRNTLDKVYVDLVEKIDRKEKINIEEMIIKMNKILDLSKEWNDDINEWFDTHQYRREREIFNQMLINQERISQEFAKNDYFAQQLYELEKSRKLGISSDKF